MSWIKDHEEQTNCCYSEECNNVADNHVYDPTTGKWKSVCSEHREEMQEWIWERMI